LEAVPTFLCADEFVHRYQLQLVITECDGWLPYLLMKNMHLYFWFGKLKKKKYLHASK
jgi:hypothetical protein